MATIRCKNTDGKGNVTYVDYEVEEPVDEELDEEITLEDALAKLRELGVEI